MLPFAAFLATGENAVSCVGTMGVIQSISEISSIRTYAAQRIEFLVEGIIAAGTVTLVTGESGSGKTTVATAIASAVDRGEPFAGFETQRRPAANMVQAAWSEVRPGVVVRPAEHRGAFDRPIVAGRAFHRADRSPANLREALQHTFRIGGEMWGDRCTCSGEICLRFEDQKVLKSTLLCAFLSASVTACP
jgi:energy-coupling factor transporter ATP-binding protein EcfA2